jgi:hypothetical protein
MFPYYQVNDTENDRIEAEHRCRSYKCKKVTVVVIANTINEPHTLIVFGFDATVKIIVVVAMQRALYSTRATAFDRYFKMDIVGFCVTAWTMLALIYLFTYLFNPT